MDAAAGLDQGVPHTTKNQTRNRNRNAQRARKKAENKMPTSSSGSASSAAPSSCGLGQAPPCPAPGNSAEHSSMPARTPAPAPSTRSTQSSREREAGNKLFTAACQPGLARVLRSSKLSSALQRYQGAIGAAQCEADRASAWKNKGAAHTRMYWLYEEQEDRGLEDVKLETLTHAANAYALAASIGRSSACKPADWCDAAWSQAHEALDTIAKAAPALFTARSEVLGAWHRSGKRLLPELHALRAHWSLLHAQGLISRSVSAYPYIEKDTDIIPLIQDLHEAGLPIEGAQKQAYLAKDQHLESEARIIQGEWELQMCIYSSHKLRMVADGMVQASTSGSEYLNLDMVWMAYDVYMSALSETRGKDLESEAILLSRLGVLLFRVLKMFDKAGRFCQQVLALAELLKPRVFHTENWYQAALGVVQALQQQQERKEEAEREAARQPYLEELAEELEEIKKANEKGGRPLLVLVYEKYPPRKPEHTLSQEPSASNLKELLKTAVVHYHPDKQPKGDSEEQKKWAVLAEQICKYLSAHYQSFK